jgi:hypothetical protein
MSVSTETKQSEHGGPLDLRMRKCTGFEAMEVHPRDSAEMCRDDDAPGSDRQ